MSLRNCCPENDRVRFIAAARRRVILRVFSSSRMSLAADHSIDKAIASDSPAPESNRRDGAIGRLCTDWTRTQAGKPVPHSWTMASDTAIVP